jgi:CubicO group peptidase (beta-lactamase class C family)
MKLFAGVLCISFMPSLVGAQMPPELDAYIEKARRDLDIPGISIAIVRGNDAAITRGYGVRELGKADRVDEHTIFDVASLTKSFTATAAAILVDEGKLSWDDAIRKYVEVHFPDPYLDRVVSVRDLLAHRVGLKPSNWYTRLRGEHDTHASTTHMRYAKEQAPFRTAQVYSNTGYTLAGEALAAASGLSWAELVRTRLIAPLGMTETLIDTDLPPGNSARPHAWVAGTQSLIRSGSGAQGGASAGVRSNAIDMAKWLRLQLNNGEVGAKRVVSARALDETHSPQVIIPTTAAMRRARGVQFFGAYGMGWNVMDYRGHRMLWHSGSADGTIAYMAVLPDDSLGVVVMVNSWIAPNVHGALTTRIIETYLRLPLTDPVAVLVAGRAAQQNAQRQTDAWLNDAATRNAAAAHPLAAYAGVFADSLYGTIRVTLDSGRLVMKLGHRGEVADLRPWNADTMFVRWRDPFFAATLPVLASFEPDGSWPVSRISMPITTDTVVATRVIGGKSLK